MDVEGYTTLMDFCVVAEEAVAICVVTARDVALGCVLEYKRVEKVSWLLVTL